MGPSRGRFWIAGEAADVAGQVSISDETGRIRLELDTHLDEFDMGAVTGDGRRLIHGTLTGGKPMSLIRCMQVQSRFGGPEGVPAETYHCEFWIRGSCVEETATFDRIDFRLTDLSAWIAQKAFLAQTDFNAEPPTLTVRPNPAFTRSAATSRGNVEFVFSATTNLNHRRVEISGTSRIRVACPEPITLRKAFSELLRPMQDLLTIATQRPQQVLDLRLASADGTIEPGDGDFVSVHFTPFGRAADLSESPWSDEMLFSLSDLLTDLGGGLDRWFTLDEEMSEVRMLATGILYRGEMFSDQRFMYAVHAAEVYHRRAFGGQAESAEDFEERRRQIIDSCPEEFQGWLKQKLSFANELSLLKRLEELRGEACQRVETLLNGVEDWEKWVRDTRNFNTHFSSRPRRIADGGKLQALAESVLVLLDDQFLKILGLSDMARNELIQRTPRFRRVQQWVASMDWSTPNQLPR